MRKLKKVFVFFLAFVFFLQVFGAEAFVCRAEEYREAAEKGIPTGRRYFVSGDFVYGIISKKEVEVCSVRKTKKNRTLRIPEKVAYKNRTYTVTRIPDNTASRFYSYAWEPLREGSSVGFPEIQQSHVMTYSYEQEDWTITPSDWAGWYIGDGFTQIKSTKVVLPKTLTYIGEGAFNGCPNLKKVQFAKKYKKLVIGENAFAAKQLKSISFPEGTYELKARAAGTTPDITIPSTVKKIGPGVVNAAVKNVKISSKNKRFKMKEGMLFTGDETKMLGISAKAGADIKLPSTTTVIAESAFAKSRVQRVNLGGNVTEIPQTAFFGCENLEQVTGTDRVTRVGIGAFYECGRLTDVGNLSGVEEIADGAFLGASALSLQISSKINISDRAFAGADSGARLQILVPEHDPVYSIENGLLLKREGNEKTVLMQTADMEKIEVPEGVTNIPVALGKDGSCREIILPESLKRQNAWFYVNAGTITYRSKEVPEIGNDFYLWNDFGEAGSGGKNAVVYVPQGTAGNYKKEFQRVSQSVKYFDDEWITLWWLFSEDGFKRMELREWN